MFGRLRGKGIAGGDDEPNSAAAGALVGANAITGDGVAATLDGLEPLGDMAVDGGAAAT